MAARFKECENARGVAQGRAPLFEKEIDELIEYVSSLENLVESPLAAKESSDAYVVSLTVYQNSLNESLVAKDAELQKLRVTVGAKSNFVDLHKDYS